MTKEEVMDEIAVGEKVWRVTVYEKRGMDVLCSVETDPSEPMALVAGEHFSEKLPFWPKGEKLPVIAMRDGKPCLVLGLMFLGINRRCECGDHEGHLTQYISRGLVGPPLHPLEVDKYYELFFGQYRIEVRYESRKSDADHKKARDAIAVLSARCHTSGHCCCGNTHNPRLN